jgi:predicted HD phosphohydrolase
MIRFWRRASRASRRIKSEAAANAVRDGEPPEQPAPEADPLAVRAHLGNPQTYIAHADEIMRRHDAQTVETVAALRQKYAQPVLGRVGIWQLFDMLARCIDPTDQRLFCVSQQVHVLQVLEEMERDGIDDEDLVLAALAHDLGKVLLLTGEVPENVVCMNRPIGTYEPGIGLDNCVLQWNHDEFAYTRLKDHLPDNVAWLVRYHSIHLESVRTYMDARDRDYADRYWNVFARYDHGTKSPFFLPKKRIEDYRETIEARLPATLVF